MAELIRPSLYGAYQVSIQVKQMMGPYCDGLMYIFGGKPLIWIWCLFRHLKGMLIPYKKAQRFKNLI